MPELIRNLPSPEGAALGAQLARFADEKEPQYKARFPKARERCKSCAFRLGTVPNQCAATVMDALKAILECKPFYCHEHMNADGNPTQLCAGTGLLMNADQKLVKCQWEFSE